MKKVVVISFLLLLIGCYTSGKTDWSNSFWGTIESEEAYLYTSDSLTAIVDKEIKKGTILYFHAVRGDFQEVFTKDPKKIKDVLYRNKFRYYLYKPKYKKLNYKYKRDSALIYEIPFDPNQSYITGERGGCYYINKHGNKTYVDRSYCHIEPVTKTTPTYEPSTTYPPKSTTKCNTVQCSGNTKKGTRCQNKTTNCSGRCHLH